MMKILITGAAGMLGRDLVDALKDRFDLVGVGLGSGRDLPIPYEEVDLADAAGVLAFWQKTRPELVFHLAAMTQVDQCETDREAAYRSNTQAVQCVAEASRKVETPVVFFSTDFVFDGSEAREYREEDLPNPLSYYGRTKADAEDVLKNSGAAFVVFRLCWLYGVRGRSFPAAILGQAKKGVPLRVVDDQFGRPTYTRDICSVLGSILDKDPQSFQRQAGQIFHLANDGVANWAEFAEETLRFAGCSLPVLRINSAELDRPARRPAHAVLSLKKTESVLGVKLRSWQEALKDFMAEYQTGPKGAS